MGALLLLSVAWSAPEFPAEAEWIPLTQAGVPYADTDEGYSQSLDLVPDADGGSTWWWADNEYLYLRMLLDGDPTGAAGVLASYVRSGGVGWFLDTDTNPNRLDELMLASYANMYYYTRYDGTGWTPSWVEAVPTADLDACDCVRADIAASTNSGDLDFLVSIAFPIAIFGAIDVAFAVMPATFGAYEDPTAFVDVPGLAIDLELPDIATRWSDDLVIDADGDGIPTPLELRHGTDPAAPDTDGGGLTDGEEDPDGDGVVDWGETDPLDPLDDVDGDGDNIPDVWEATCTLGGPDDDRDDDGWPDGDEGRDDNDLDHLFDFCDTDDDNDGIPTSAEGTGDTDGDGVPDARDRDADDDNQGDLADGTLDEDCDNILSFQDAVEDDGPCADPDGDGLDNEAEARCGSNPRSADSDNDGVGDWIESCDDDLDCDQLPDRVDGVADAGFCDTAAASEEEDACRDADPADPWHDCPGEVTGGAGCAGCTTGRTPVRPWMFLLLALTVWRRR